MDEEFEDDEFDEEGASGCSMNIYMYMLIYICI